MRHRTKPSLSPDQLEAPAKQDMRRLSSHFRLLLDYHYHSLPYSNRSTIFCIAQFYTSYLARISHLLRN